MSVKIGDEIVIYKHQFRNSDPRIPRDIVKIIRLTKTRAVYGNSEGQWLPIHVSVRTESDLAVARQHITKEREECLSRNKRQAERDADPVVQLARQCASNDNDTWEKIPIGRLRQIVSWIDEAKESQ